jgi:signal recognition particle subunit SEC65
MSYPRVRWERRAGKRVSRKKAGTLSSLMKKMKESGVQPSSDGKSVRP